MDRYSHHNNYNSPPPSSGALKRFILLILFVLTVIALGVGFYLYKPRLMWMHKMASNVISIAHENTTETKNDPTPPIHFEFYTALTNAQMAEDHTLNTDNAKASANKAEASLHKELEKEISEVAHIKRTPT